MIKIEVKYATLCILCNLYDVVSEYNACTPKEIQFSKEYKAVMNIIHLLFLKLKRKQLVKNERSKEFHLKFEYHQAYFLLHFIDSNITYIKGIREQNLLLDMSRKIHQEL